MKQFYISVFISWITFISGQQTTPYNVTDEGGLGRNFDGIGGLSGGGPGFGASLQILKVEIGGDDQSTDGTEASHMHEEWDQNYNRGYEWWLMEQAKLINPNIKLWGLSWAWPSWLGDPTVAITTPNSPYYDNNKTATYIINWILGAKKYHNLTIDYIGIWNERYCDFNYILTLRKALDLNDLTKNVEIVACDTSFYDDWDRMVANQTVFDSVYAFGVHYPGTIAPQNAIDSNKILWSSEDYSTYNDDIGAGCWARILNQNYVNGYMTSTTAWNLIASYYLGLPYAEDGLMTAIQPFSGYYEVKNPIWITAHTTQFTEIGWKYLQHGSGVGLLSNGGSYVTLTSPDSKDLTMVIETITYDHSVCIRPYIPPYNVTQQTVTFIFGGTFSTFTQFYLWQTNLKFNGLKSTAFVYRGAYFVQGRQITLNLDVDSVYTFTTKLTGTHGSFSNMPNSTAFPLPYVDNFQSYNESQEPNYLTPQVGSWEIVMDDDNSKIARQTILSRPVTWCQPNTIPLAVMGDITWSDLNITATLRIPEVNGTDSVFIAVQVQTTNCNLYDSKGLFLWLNKTVGTYRITTDITALNVLQAGALGNGEMKRGQWYTLSLIVENGSLSAIVDGVTIFSSYIVPQKYLQNGFAAIGSGSFGYSDINYLGLNLPSTGTVTTTSTVTATSTVTITTSAQKTTVSEQTSTKGSASITITASMKFAWICLFPVLSLTLIK